MSDEPKPGQPGNAQMACYDCAHRRAVPHSAHSECVHPERHREAPHFIAGIAGGRAATNALPRLRIEFVEHAIKNGWAAWPINYDPVWLVRCDGFTPQAKPDV
ncbi:MAG: hypothetical protein NW206_19965 [Hyphomonadaceae bacterium]|nr:hypothetical protein [Hyphomonadaceae bacterium]